MGNTYTQFYYHIIFVVEKRDAMLDKAWRARLFEYMAGILRNSNCKVLAINGVEDHVHVFFGAGPAVTISKVMQAVKGDSSAWINRERLCRCTFRWQPGFAGFSYHESMIDKVVNYILKQEEHHKKVTFRDEYIAFLKLFNIQYNDLYTFKDPK